MSPLMISRDLFVSGKQNYEYCDEIGTSLAFVNDKRFAHAHVENSFS